ncbi:hypothetical protein [Haladaptatus sp. DYF46]|uniref:hypothetical protein n=1 Tax=Haladaptatus sp. DYF46 TaxID=2886041 RepID=UPI001E376242|nr:hypothetical protein [Haladaptatus sp. DYF46]
MISNSEKEVLRKCLSECPLPVGVDSKYFTKEEICTNAGEESGFKYTTFKRFLTTKTKPFCEQCNEPFSSNCKEVYRTKKTVYTLDPVGISEGVIRTASEAGPLEFVEDVSPVDGQYRARCRFGEHNITFEFFSERDAFLQSKIDPFDMEFPVLLRSMNTENHQRHRFRWEELLSEQFSNRLSSIITDVRNKVTAVFAEYTEEFVENHRTEIKRSLRDYFTRSGYSVHSEVAEHCPELEEYGIEVETADYVCIGDNEKILVTHGKTRDGWYMQRFVEGKLTSVENEPIFSDFHEQIDEKIRRYKRISKQLSSASQVMRGLGGIIAVVTIILAALSTNEIEQFVQSLPIVSTYSSELTVGIIFFNIFVMIIFIIMLLFPYLKEKAFSWKTYPCGASRSRVKIIRHMKYGLD